MAYNQAQLVQAYTFANAGTAPTAAQTIALTALANQNASGALTDPQTLSQTIALAADNTTAVSVDTYAFFTGVAPSQAGLAALNAAYVGTGAQVGLNGENRFIAQSVSLALGNAAAKTAFAASYGSLSIADATASAYNVIVGNQTAGVNAPAAVAFLSGAAQVAYYTNFVKANVPGLATGSAADIDLAVKAAIVGEIFFNATQANNGLGIGSYAVATNNLLKDLSDDGILSANNAAGINLFTAYGATGTGNAGTPGSLFALTDKVDALTGTANDDTFNGVIGTTTTVNFGDTIDGGAGTDTVLIANDKTGAQTVPGLQLKNVEIIAVNNTATATPGTDIVTISAAGLTGVSSIVSSGLGDVTVTGIGTSIAVGVKDVAFTATSNATIKAAAARSLNLSGVTIATGGVVTVDVQDVAANQAASFSVVNTGKAATISELKFGGTDAVKTTGLTVNATAGITIGKLTTFANELKTITVTGGSTFAVTTAVASNVLTTVDASANAGGVTLSVDATALTSLKGGTGADKFTTANALLATAVIDLGAGNDTLTLGAAPNAGATINGGDGTDTLGLTTSAAFTSVTKAAITGFEVVDLSGTAQTYDVTQLTGFTGGIVVSGGSVVLSNAAANPTYSVTGATINSLEVQLATATGTADNVNLNVGLASKNATTITAYKAAGVETLTINSINGTAAGATTQAVNNVKLDTGNTTLNKVVVTGAGQIEVNVANAAIALSIDASANTGGLKVSGAPGFKVDVIGTGLNDTIASGTAGGSINAGKGGDAITLGAGVDTVILKAGDSIYDATNGTALTTGLGNKGTMDVITTFTSGTDKIDLTQIAGFVGSAQGVASVTVADTTALTTLLTQANIFKDGGGLVRGVLDVNVGGDHYIVVDANHDGAYSASADLVVKLIGTGVVAGDINFGS
jgi:S-layer protein